MNGPSFLDPAARAKSPVGKRGGRGRAGASGTIRSMESQAEVGKVAVICAGSWGTALAVHATRRAARVVLWSRRAEDVEAMRRDRVNPRYLRDVSLPDEMSFTGDLEEALEDAELVVVAVPSHAMREVLGAVAAALTGPRFEGAPTPNVLIASKGVEVESLSTMIDVARAVLPEQVAVRTGVLGGPSFAAEVARGLPTLVVVAAEQLDRARAIQAQLAGQGLRIYVTDDVMGVEVGGAFKNVIALAAGMCDGAGLGMNARAGLITRGLNEITRLGMALGARRETFAGLAGMGDLVLTCTGGLSRNRRAGLALGEGRQLAQVLEEMGMVVEGVRNTQSALKLAQRERIELPIVETMHDILYGELSVRDAVGELMRREAGHELD